MSAEAGPPSSSGVSGSGAPEAPHLAEAGAGSGPGQAPIMRDPDFPLGASFSPEEIELMRSVLYSKRENVLLVHELFARTLSSNCALAQHRAVSCVVTVYREWIRVSAIHSLPRLRPFIL